MRRVFLRAAILLLAGIAAAVTWSSRVSARPVVLVRAGSPVLAGGYTRAAGPADAPATTDELAGFLAHATPDDVARGVNALRVEAQSQPTPAVPTLSAAQEAALSAPTLAGRDARVARDALRAERRAAEAAWLDASASLAEVLPEDALATMMRTPPRPAPAVPARVVVAPGSPLETPR